MGAAFGLHNPQVQHLLARLIQFYACSSDSALCGYNYWNGVTDIILDVLTNS